ncbi:hypothetical protein [Ferrimicrobium sp.]|uniref:hypothetical protein n=1 Tax=Ferrimicrobium sp. TaxID=2926050 RepID=UPI0026270BBD|nr:hypothetical protein [Ferrimicrobium sp.]
MGGVYPDIHSIVAWLSLGKLRPSQLDSTATASLTLESSRHSRAENVGDHSFALVNRLLTGRLLAPGLGTPTMISSPDVTPYFFSFPCFREGRGAIHVPPGPRKA